MLITQMTAMVKCSVIYWSPSVSSSISYILHKSGHTLGLLITREHDDHIDGINVFDYCLSDHHSISLHLEGGKVPTIEKEIVYHKLKSIDRDQLKSDIGNSTLHQKPPEDIDQLAEAYNSVFGTIIVKHAPLLKKEGDCEASQNGLMTLLTRSSYDRDYSALSPTCGMTTGPIQCPVLI